ncbi:MAG: Spo0E family sporulation regulatory protein-aspartic acid phosphatase [Lachnospiraceae bacterium]|nr:Spo0E family sporulation regulatory protein-aspartic acid phosphatase [Lachnospiraceae bacterium]
MSREILQQEIEDARARLHLALESGESVSEFYDKSVYLDQLIADYIDLCEREKECV